ncbi:MAG: hypothetical protein SXQ77_11640 [Halobacteria archaeon]|nr:hypothetical protein [Halobacteria archaeon]
MSDSNERDTVSRRRLLKIGGASAVGLTGLTTVSGTVTAQSFMQSCQASFQADVPDDFPTFYNGELQGKWPESPDELVQFSHGWTQEKRGYPQIGESMAYVFGQSLQHEGYNTNVAGNVYNASRIYGKSVEDSKDAGRRAADWLAGYMDSNPGMTVHLAGHSNGGPAVLAMLNRLAELEKQVATASLLGPAAENDTVTKGWFSKGEFYDGVKNGAEEVHNYYSENDGVLGIVYRLAPATRDSALGFKGADGKTPSNYHDHDVTDLVSNHCQYFVPGEGCMSEVVSNL